MCPTLLDINELRMEAAKIMPNGLFDTFRFLPQQPSPCSGIQEFVSLCVVEFGFKVESVA